MVSQPDEAIDIVVAALLIAQEEYPELDIDSYLRQLDDMAIAITALLPEERYPLRVINTINHYLYDQLGFVGNTDDYYNPCNSFLNEVLDQRKGIPLTLSLVYLELAKRLDFPMVGVDMPAHFLIRPNLPDIEFLVDPFHGGEVMFVDDCQKRLKEIYGQPIALTSDFLSPSTPRRFLARMLSNLKMVYLTQEQWHDSLAAIDRILLLYPEAPMQRRDRGLLYYQIGNWIDARQDLQAYLDAAPKAQDAIAIENILKQIS